VVGWFKRACVSITSFIEGVNSCALLYLAGGVILLVTFSTIVDVVARSIRQSIPNFDNVQLSGYALLFITSMGTAYAMRSGRHVRITVLFSRFPQQIQNKLLVVIYALALIYVSVLILFSAMLLRDSLALNAMSYGIMPWPLACPQGIIVFGLCMLWLQVLLNVRAFWGNKLRGTNRCKDLCR